MNFGLNCQKYGFFALILGLTALIAPQTSANESQLMPYSASFGEDTLAQVNSVTQLRDVSPQNWSFQALKTLVEEYGCIEGYPDQTYRGDRALSRNEFAAGLNSCMEALENRLSQGSPPVATPAPNTPVPTGISTQDMFRRAFNNDTGRFYDITNLSGQANLIFGWRNWQNSFMDTMITNDAEFLEAIYQDTLNQQMRHSASPIRTRDLPNPYETSVFENPSYMRPMIPSSPREIRF